MNLEDAIIRPYEKEMSHLLSEGDFDIDDFITYCSLYHGLTEEPLKSCVRNLAEYCPVTPEHYKTCVHDSALATGCETDRLDAFISALFVRYFIHRTFIRSLAITFGLRDIREEEIIRARRGWYLELKALDYYWYPPECIRLHDGDLGRRIKTITGSGENYVICHHWVEMAGASESATRKQYLENCSRQFGEAEYVGRKKGARPYETERMILDEILEAIRMRLPLACITQSETMRGIYNVCFREDDRRGMHEQIMGEIKTDFETKYPGDRFVIG